MQDLAQRLARRFEEEICRVCVHRTAEGGCTLTDERKCPVFEWAEQIAALVQSIESDYLADYFKQVEAIICPECLQDDSGRCAEREHLNCPLDLYMGLVIRILTEEFALLRTSRKHGQDK